MILTCKLKDLEPGQVSVPKELKAPDFVGKMLWAAIQRSLEIPENVWCVTVELNVRADCIIDGDAPPAAERGES